MTDNDVKQEDYSSMVNSNTILLNFEGWIKYVEGFSRGIQSAKTVEASQVMSCVGEILEYMKTLKKDLITILTHCEIVLEENEKLKQQETLKLEVKDGKEM